MKTKLLIAFSIALLLLPGEIARAAETNSARAELQVIVTRIQTRLKQGQRTEKELDADLKALNALFERYKSQETEAVAEILYVQAKLYLEVLDNLEQGQRLIHQLKRDFPKTKAARNADQTLAAIREAQAAKKVREHLAVGMAFPRLNEKDVYGKPLSLAEYRDKVLLIDFWATWCMPCVDEMPVLLQTYRKYHGKGFEIIGISLDNDQMRLTGFIHEKGVPWQQYFDGLGWKNRLAVKYGITSIPATYLLDREGKIIGKDLRGDELEKAVARALAGK